MTVKYANAYWTDRLYGGPEEGGWWYEAGEPVQSVLISQDELEEWLDKQDPELREFVACQADLRRLIPH